MYLVALASSGPHQRGWNNPLQRWTWDWRMSAHLHTGNIKHDLNTLHLCRLYRFCFVWTIMLLLQLFIKFYKVQTKILFLTWLTNFKESASKRAFEGAEKGKAFTRKPCCQCIFSPSGRYLVLFHKRRKRESYYVMLVKNTNLPSQVLFWDSFLQRTLLMDHCFNLPMMSLFPRS